MQRQRPVHVGQYRLMYNHFQDTQTRLCTSAMDPSTERPTTNTSFLRGVTQWLISQSLASPSADHFARCGRCHRYLPTCSIISDQNSRLGGCNDDHHSFEFLMNVISQLPLESAKESDS